MVSRNFQKILQTLSDHDIDFILVGALGAVLQGAPINTFDIDIVHSTERKNVEKLLAALESLDAFYRIQPERQLRPDISHLSSPGHHTLMTRFGPLDILGHIGNGR